MACNRKSRNPPQSQSIAAAARPADRGRRVHVEGEAAVDAPELVRPRPAVWKSGLDKDPRHEAEGTGRASLLGFNRERFLREFQGLAAALGLGVPNGPLQDLPEAMRTVVSTRQGESLRRLSSCPSVS